MQVVCLLILLGWMAVIALLLFRLSYDYSTVRTDYFIVTLPRVWTQNCVQIIALLEVCRSAAEGPFGLTQDLPTYVRIAPSWRPSFWFEPDLGRIEMRFVFGPAIDVWFFAVNFAVAHEYGHFILDSKTIVESEAWANAFCIYALRFVALKYRWPHLWHAWLIKRDIWTGIFSLSLWRYIPGRRRQISARFWELWAMAQRNSGSTVTSVKKE